MAKQTTPQQQNPGMVLVGSYIASFATTALVIAIANMWFPQHIVLGTISISKLWAILLSAGAVALITTFSMPFITQWELQRKRIASTTELFSIYLAINFFTVWLITRASDIFGMGVTSWLVVLVLASTLDLVQGMTMMWLESMKNQKTQ